MSGAINSYPQFELAVGAILLYGGGRLATSSMAQNTAAPGRRAVGHWLPIAAVVTAAALTHQADLALELIFATSIAALALVGGCIAIMGSHAGEPPLWPAPARKAAAILLPTTIIVFLIGFGSHFTTLSIVALLVQGAIVLYVHLDRSEPADESQEPVRLRFVLFALATLIILLGAGAAVFGVAGIGRDSDFPSPTPLATTVLSPLLVASMLLGGSHLAQNGKSWAAAATHAGVAQLNLCLLLPLFALAWQIKHGGILYYPMATWRVDSVVLMILAAASLPAVAGRWRPGRSDGAVLIFIYVGYVLATILVSVMV